MAPANAMLSVELSHLAAILDSAGELRNVSQKAKEWSSRIHNAIWKTTVSEARDVLLQIISVIPAPLIQVVDNIFAYETNGKVLVGVSSNQFINGAKVLAGDT